MNRVLSNERITEGIYKMVIEYPAPYSKSLPEPGQFIMVKVNDTGHILPRPISICDAGENTVTLLYKTKGYGTRYMSSLKCGDSIYISGPFGHGFDTGYAADSAVIVGGGIGIAPLLYLQKRLSSHIRTKVFLGFSDEPYLTDMFRGKLNEDIFVTTGNAYITDLLDRFLKRSSVFRGADDYNSNSYGAVNDGVSKSGAERDGIKTFTPDGCDVIYACGPRPMLVRIKDTAAKYGIPCQISMEEKMCCGMGACLVCSCKTKDSLGKDCWNYKRVCCDGPVFMSEDIIFD